AAGTRSIRAGGGRGVSRLPDANGGRGVVSGAGVVGVATPTIETCTIDRCAFAVTGVGWVRAVRRMVGRRSAGVLSGKQPDLGAQLYLTDRGVHRVFQR